MAACSDILKNAIFWLGRPYCYFRLPIVVAIIWKHFFELSVVENLNYNNSYV